MAQKLKSIYVCDNCGYESPKWLGKCPGCNEWNTLTESVIETVKNVSAPKISKNIAAKTISEISVVDEHRYYTNISELDRVLGGGIVKGSVVLLSGDPGIGKSTILLQICGSIDKSLNILYVSGEESSVQIKLRAKRLSIENNNLKILPVTDTQAICEYISTEKPDLVMVDSIQTLSIDELSSSSGSIVQVRESTNLLLRTGKSLDIPIIIVGHVNKGGDIAGPKILEHIVDTVLYFEGERNQSYRILRAIKNRYGSTNEIGVFEMGDKGLREVDNPSMMLLSGRSKNVSGSSIACIMEGSRPILAEVQALVTTTGFGNPRRMCTGYDYNRYNLMLAVLEKRNGLYFSNLDAYLNVAGGMRLDEPAADLPVVMALVSALRDVPLSEDIVAFGEVGLSGEIRNVPRALLRINEAARLGFKKCVIPASCIKQLDGVSKDIELIPVRYLKDVLDIVK